MRTIFVAAPALLFAGMVVAQGDGRPDPMDPRAKVPPVEFRSAFEGYRRYADAESDLRDWRRSNEEVGAAGGQGGHRPGQGPGTQTSKPQPGKPESAGRPAEKNEGARPHQGHGGHK
jgi:hypothetical protein